MSHYLDLLRALTELEHLELGQPLTCPTGDLLAICRNLLADDPKDEIAWSIIARLAAGSA